jgi:hypothetical protein
MQYNEKHEISQFVLIKITSEKDIEIQSICACNNKNHRQLNQQERI